MSVKRVSSFFVSRINLEGVLRLFCNFLADGVLCGALFLARNN